MMIQEYQETASPATGKRKRGRPKGSGKKHQSPSDPLSKPVAAPSGGDHSSAKYAKANVRRSPRLAGIAPEASASILLPLTPNAFSMRTPNGFRKAENRPTFLSPIQTLPTRSASNGNLNGFSLFTTTPDMSPSIFGQSAAAAFMKVNSVRRSPRLSARNGNGGFAAFSPTVFLRSPGLKGSYPFPPLSDVPIEMPPSICFSDTFGDRSQDFIVNKKFPLEDMSTLRGNPFSHRPEQFYNFGGHTTDHDDDDGKHSAHSSVSALHDDIHPLQDPNVQLTALPPYKVEEYVEPNSQTTSLADMLCVDKESDDAKDSDVSPPMKHKKRASETPRLSRGSANGNSAGSSCHQCKSRRAHAYLAHCQNRGLITESPGGKRTRMKRPCRKKYCSSCLSKFYGEKMPNPERKKEWTCPACREICTCAACRKGKLKVPKFMKLEPTTMSPATLMAANLVYQGDLALGLTKFNLDDIPQDIKSAATKAADYIVKQHKEVEHELFKLGLPALPELPRVSAVKGRPKLVSRRRQQVQSDDEYVEEGTFDSD